jgi:hypothetical protein
MISSGYIKNYLISATFTKFLYRYSLSGPSETLLDQLRRIKKIWEMFLKMKKPYLTMQPHSWMVYVLQRQIEKNYRWIEGCLLTLVQNLSRWILHQLSSPQFTVNDIW